MNKVILMGRLTKDPVITYSQSNQSMAIARYMLAVSRIGAKEGQPQADFVQCVAFGKLAEFAEKYLYQGLRVCISGRIQTGSYTDKEGRKVYTTEVIADSQEFADGKKDARWQSPKEQTHDKDGFIDIPDNVDLELPFN